VVNSIFSFNIGDYGFYNESIEYIPQILYSNFWNNEVGNFYNCGEDIGNNVTTNSNGDPCDIFYNIQLDPLFLDPENGDFHLTENSPCIDAGDPNSPLDPDGTIADMGAFYFDQNSSIDEELSSAELVLQNYPNPFNSSTKISFNLTTEFTESTEILIYNIKGQKVRVLECVNSFKTKATESLSHIVWNGDDESGKPVNSGIYFYKLKSGKYSSIKKMLLLR